MTDRFGEAPDRVWTTGMLGIADIHPIRYVTLMRNVVSIAMMITSLCACTNRVILETPWFQANPVQAHTPLRDGVWRARDTRCKTDESEPAERWPICAQWRYQRGDQSLSPRWLEDGKGRHRIRTYLDWSVSDNVIVDGDPMILQSTDCSRGPEEAQIVSDSLAADTAVDAAEIPARDPPRLAPRFCYAAVRATAFDGHGHITAVEAWPVLCGPWSRNGGNATDQPWPGLRLVGDNCVAASEGALRDAAQRSREVALGKQLVGQWHWVRDDWH